MIITHTGHPYHGREVSVIRVKYRTHVDLLVSLDGECGINVDSTWTDYWERRGEQPPQVSQLLSIGQARRLRALLGRLKEQVERGEDEEE